MPAIDQRDASQRVQLPCHECGIFDTDPRHHYLGVDDSGMPFYAIKHMDCCRDAGCPTGHCNELLEQSGNARGEELISHVTSLPPSEVPDKEDPLEFLQRQLDAAREAQQNEEAK